MSATQTIKGCCPLDCPDTCAWVAQVEDGRVTRVEGAKDHPFTRGVLCAKVNDYPNRTYAPDRLLHPLRRVGTKGEGTFERISWDVAIDTIATRFADIIARDGAEALLPLFYYGSMGVVQCHALMRLFNAMGASGIHGDLCGAPGVSLMMAGHPVGVDPEEYVESEFILLWGVNVLSTGHHHWHFMNEARKTRGARIVCIDPRRTKTAAASDQHIAIRPGTDAILASGMARIMFEEGLGDLDYARAALDDLDAYRAQVAEWTPARVAEACGIDTDIVLALARDYARARPAMIRCGVGPQQGSGGEGLVWGLSALNILAGHAKAAGGGLAIISMPDMNPFKAARMDLRSERGNSIELPKIGAILSGDTPAPPIKGLMVWNTNPAVVLPNAGQVRRGLAREDLFTVVLEHFMTDTAKYADIVLPATTQLEHFDLHGAWGHHYISVNHPAIEPLGEAKSHGAVMRLLARRMRLNHPALQESDEEVAASVLPKELPLAELSAKGWIKRSPARPDLTANERKLSVAGKMEPPAGTDEPAALRLLTPKSHYFLNSSFANMERQRKSQGQPTLEMNTADAKSRALADGQRIVIRNAQGTLHATLGVTDGICAGAVSLPGKWWSTPSETEAVSNRLTPSKWLPSGQPAYNDTFVVVESAS